MVMRPAYLYDAGEPCAAEANACKFPGARAVMFHGGRTAGDNRKFVDAVLWMGAQAITGGGCQTLYDLCKSHLRHALAKTQLKYRVRRFNYWYK